MKILLTSRQVATLVEALKMYIGYRVGDPEYENEAVDDLLVVKLRDALQQDSARLRSEGS